MTHWLIIPRDPLIFRDGRPFTADPGSHARSLPFPFPSTLIGAARTRSGVDTATGKFDPNRIPDLLTKRLRGPLLAELDGHNKASDLLLPAPADALLMKPNDQGQAMRHWLRPLELPAGVETDLKGSGVVGPVGKVNEKPHPSPPCYWRWESYKKWLIQPEDTPVDPSSLGHSGPSKENRVHVSIDPQTQTGLPGALFQTRGLEFVYLDGAATPISLDKAKVLGLLVETDADLKEGLGYLGGEHRVANWKSSDYLWPDCPSAIREHIKRNKACRIVLLTPAIFESGFSPKTILQAHNARLKAAAVRRYQTVSGWDYAFREGRQRGRPKPARRLAPASSVYYLTLDRNPSEQAIDTFIDAVWMQNISDDTQSNLDGFGLAVLGTWDGKFHKMEV